MVDERITKEDLLKFKQDLLTELRQILKEKNTQVSKPWLKSYEVRAMLGISRGTLQTLRSNGTLKGTQVGGLLFYAYDDIARLMQNGKK